MGHANLINPNKDADLYVEREESNKKLTSEEWFKMAKFWNQSKPDVPKRSDGTHTIGMVIDFYRKHH